MTASNLNPPKDMTASVRQRLLDRARAEGNAFSELLQYYAMERFLYRLSTSPHAERFVLKGALLFVVWQAPRSRSTMDIDLLGRMSNRVDDVVDAIREVCSQAVEPDGMTFDPESVHGTPISDAAEYTGVRVRCRGLLGVARVTMQLDVGFGDAVVPPPLSLTYPTLLDLPAPQLMGYSRETAIAEKLNAMVTHGMLNSRMKDFYDVALLATHFDFDGQQLAAAIRATFDARDTPLPKAPTAFTREFADDPAKQIQWSAFLRKSRLDVSAYSLTQAVENVAAFLGPVVRSLAIRDDFDLTWQAPGPWA